jgi:protoheme IX farnesyltransferase
MSVARQGSLAVKSTVDSSTWAVIRAYLALTKPRITAFMVLMAYCAAIVAQRGLPSLRVTVALILGVALSSGGSAAINMWYDRDVDKLMKRTMNRPIPSGMVSPNAALWFGITLGILSVAVCCYFLNGLTALLSAAGYVYYAVVYTMWLKRSTPQNIVIGGAAGAIPPLMGWSAVTGHLSLAAVLMFAVIFLWTPPHFWALALLKNEDYRRAGIPMMPVVRGARTTKVQCVWYAVVLWIAAIAIYFTGTVGVIYLVGTLFVGGLFLIVNLMMLWEPDDRSVWVKRTFLSSLLYVPVMFFLMVADAVL